MAFGFDFKIRPVKPLNYKPRSKEYFVCKNLKLFVWWIIIGIQKTFIIQSSEATVLFSGNLFIRPHIAF